MVEIEMTDDSLVVHVKGVDKLWAMTNKLVFPLEHVAKVELGVTFEARSALRQSVRFGVNLPHVVTAGRFYREGKIAFWDVHSGEHAITIRLLHDDYTHVVVDVADPAAMVAAITSRLVRAQLPVARVVE